MYTPQSVDPLGRITSIDENGRRVVYHSNKEEARAFFGMIEALSAGRDELGLLLYSDQTPERALARAGDGRSDEQLRDDWMRKVVAKGLSPEVALDWLTKRIQVQKSQ